MARTKTKRKASDGELFAVSQMYSLQKYMASHWLTHAFDWSTDQFVAAALPLVKRKGRHGLRRMQSSLASPRPQLSQPEAGREGPGRYDGLPQLEKAAESWTVEEDDRLQAAVLQHGENFNPALVGLPGKTMEHCLSRWRHLQSNKDALSKGRGTGEAVEDVPWTEDEDERVLEMFHEYGKKWRIIADGLPGRTRKEVKKRWRKVLIHEARELGMDVDSPPEESFRPAYQQQQLQLLPSPTVASRDSPKQQRAAVRSPLPRHQPSGAELATPAPSTWSGIGQGMMGGSSGMDAVAAATPATAVEKRGMSAASSLCMTWPGAVPGQTPAGQGGMASLLQATQQVDF